MSKVQEMVVLANSYKEGGLCLAGKDLTTKKWIRPVSNSNGGSLSKLAYSNITPLNIVSMDLSQHVPLVEQPENFLISDSKTYIQGNFPRLALENLIDTPSNLWMYGSKKDRVTPQEILSNQAIHQSLYLIKVEKLKIIVESNFCGGTKLVGEFHYNDVSYRLSITDLSYCHYKNNPIGFFKIETNQYLCLSLGAFFVPTGHHYKLIAAIL